MMGVLISANKYPEKIFASPHIPSEMKSHIFLLRPLCLTGAGERADKPPSAEASER